MQWAKGRQQRRQQQPIPVRPRRDVQGADLAERATGQTQGAGQPTLVHPGLKFDAKHFPSINRGSHLELAHQSYPNFCLIYLMGKMDHLKAKFANRKMNTKFSMRVPNSKHDPFCSQTAAVDITTAVSWPTLPPRPPCLTHRSKAAKIIQILHITL